MLVPTKDSIDAKFSLVTNYILLICCDILMANTDGAAPVGVVLPSCRVVMILSGLVHLRGSSLGESPFELLQQGRAMASFPGRFPLVVVVLKTSSPSRFPWGGRAELVTGSPPAPQVQCINRCAYVCFSL